MHRATRGLLSIVLRQMPGSLGALVGPSGLRLLLNTATAVLVITLPYTAAASARAASPTSDTTVAPLATALPDSVRAQAASRGVIAVSRNPTTVPAQEARPVVERTIQKDDTLWTMANYYKISLEALAFANGITDESEILSIGSTIVIPPGEGALYTVKDGDTVEGVAEQFKVDPAAIMSYNRVYFEPEHFAPGQLIFVPGAAMPALKRIEAPRFITPPSTAALPARSGRLGWPVRGVITQYFWWGHNGVDIAAPYGSPIVASDNGVVIATGWVPVGGLRVCVQHAGGLQTCYYHTGAVFVSPGETVSRGQQIASIGMTGVTTGPHVHWELKINGVLVNPLDY